MAEKVLQMMADITEIFDEEYGMRHLITPANTAQKLIDKGYRKLSADVVEVVRCKDCQHYIDRRCYVGNRKPLFTYDVNIHSRKPNDFCSYGERKNEQ